MPSPGNGSLPLPVTPSISLDMNGRWCGTELMTRTVVSRHLARIPVWGLAGTARINLTPRREGPLCCIGRGTTGASGSKAQGEEHRDAAGNRALQGQLTWFRISALALFSCVTLSKPHKPSEPPFPHLQMGTTVLTCRAGEASEAGVWYPVATLL